MPVEHYSTLFPTTGDTRRLLLGKMLYVLASGGGGGGGGSGTNDVIYETSDPNTEGLVPPLPALSSIAYKRDGTGAMFGWNPNTLTWS